MSKVIEDKVRVLRIIEYIGPRSWVEGLITKSIQGKKIISEDKTITAVTITQYPEVLEQARIVEDDKDDNN